MFCPPLVRRRQNVSNQTSLEMSECYVCAGRPTGSSRPAGAKEDRTAASGRIRLTAHRHGILQDERGKVTQISIVFNCEIA